MLQAFVLPFALYVILLTGCVGMTPVVDEPGHVADEKWIEINERLNLQESEIEKLRASVEILNHPVSRKKEEARMIPPPPSREETSAMVEENKVALPSDDEEEVVADSRHEILHWYFQGVQELSEKQYEKALKSFQEFLKAGRQHPYADRAQFQLAKSYYMNREYALSVREINRLESDFPYSFMIPDALWIKASSYLNLGQEYPGFLVLREVVRLFPRYPRANDAAARSASLPKRGPQIMHRQ